MGIKSTTKYLYSLIPYADITTKQESGSVQASKDRMPRTQRRSDLIEVKYIEANKGDYSEYEQSETPLRLNDVNFDNTYNSISLKSSDLTITNDLGLEIGYVEITTAGGSYSAGTLTATGGGGNGFSGSYTVDSGAVDTVTIINRGTGYTSTPTIVLSDSGDGTAVLTPHLLHPLNPLDLSFNNKENPCYTLAFGSSITLAHNVNDYATFSVADTGDLTIATVGDGTTDSDLTLDVDGGLILDSATGSITCLDNGSAYTPSAGADIANKTYVDAVPTNVFSKTVIKVMPNEFMVNDDYNGRASNMIEDDTADTLGYRMGSTLTEGFAFVKIPDGYDATHVQVYASASTSNAVRVLQFNYQTGATTSKGTGDFNASIDITDITAGATVDLVIKIEPASTITIIYGALVTIAAS